MSLLEDFAVRFVGPQDVVDRARTGVIGHNDAHFVSRLRRLVPGKSFVENDAHSWLYISGRETMSTSLPSRLSRRPRSRRMFTFLSRPAMLSNVKAASTRSQVPAGNAPRSSPGTRR